MGAIDSLDLTSVVRDAKAATSGAAVPGADLIVSTTEAARPVLPVWTYDYMAKVAVTANSLVASASDFWARNLAEPPIAVMKNDQPDRTHPLARVFANPNPFYSQDELWQAVIYELCASEKGAFIVAPLSRAGEPLALWPKRSDEVRIVPSRESFIGRYEMKVGTDAWEPIDPKQIAVVWFRFVHPTDKWGSWSPVSKVRREIRTDTNMGRWVDYALKNMGKSSGIVGIDGIEDQETANAVRDYLNENVMQAHNALKLSVVAGKVSVKEFGAKFSDLDFGPLQNRIEVATARGFGLAPELLHILSSTEAGNGLGGERQTALKRQAYDDTLIPISKMLAAKVAAVFAPVYDIDPESVVFDWTGVQALEEDKDGAVTRAKNACDFWTVDECRAETGKGPHPEKAIGAMTPVQVRLMAQAARTAPPEPTPVKMQTKALPHHELLRKSIDATAVKHEAAMEKAARAIFAKQRKAVLALVPEGKSLNLKSEYDTLLRQIEDALKGEWEGAFDPLVGKAMAEGAALHEAALGVTFDLSSKRAIAAVTRRVDKVKGADDTTRDAIRAVVAKAREDGSAMRDVAKTIGEVFDQAEGYRASMIARTESIGAANEGGHVLASDAVDQGIAVTKTWIAFNDSRTRPEHSAADGESVKYDEAFTTGLQFPGDPAGSAGDVINCRCSVAYEGSGPVPDESE